MPDSVWPLQFPDSGDGADPSFDYLAEKAYGKGEIAMTILQSALFFGIIAVTTVLTRALPFLLFPSNKETPPYITYLGNVIPFAMIGMLVVYCLKNVSLCTFPFGLPEIIAIAVITVLHLWKGNTLLSIGAGTVIYMILVQFVFI